MKKKSYILFILLILSVVVNIIAFYHNRIIGNNLKMCENEISPTYDYLNSITVRNFESAIKNSKGCIVYIGRPDCSDCNYFEPIFREIINQYNLYDKIIYLNVKQYRENNTEETWTQFKNKYGFTQTPAIIKYDNGTVSSMIEWDSKEGLSKERFTLWLMENGIIET